MEAIEKSEEVHEDFLGVHENKNSRLLCELVNEIEKFLTNNKQSISSLADVIKRIFYCGLTCKINVSEIRANSFESKCKRAIFIFALCKRIIISCIAMPDKAFKKFPPLSVSFQLII